MAITRKQWRDEVLEAREAHDAAAEVLTSRLQDVANARRAAEDARAAYNEAKDRLDALRATRLKVTGEDDA